MNKNSIQEEDINYESIEDIEKAIEYMQYFANIIKERIAKAEINIKEFKRLPIGILILIFIFVAVTVGYAFTNPILSYILSILFFGIISVLIDWGALKYTEACKNKENLEHKLGLIEEKIKKENIKMENLSLQDNITKEIEPTMVEQDVHDLSKPMVRTRGLAKEKTKR